MPQMAPINWLSLFIMFSLIFIMFNMMYYFIYLPLTPKSKNFNKIETKSMNWKWKLIYFLYLILLLEFLIYH